MLEASQTHRAAHHQQGKIQLLKYENNLLSERNQALAFQNKRLLAQLQQAHSYLSDIHSIQTSKLRNQKQQITRRAKQDYHSLFADVDHKTKKIIGSQLFTYRELINSSDSSITQIYDCLTNIVGQLLSNLDVKKQQQTKDYLNCMEERLMARKHARNRTQRIVHLIKQPTEQFNCSYRVIAQELNQQREMFYKLIRRIKKIQINPRLIEEAIDKIQDYMANRWNLRKQQNRLALIQRQFELGVVDGMGQADAARSQEQLKIKLTKSKQAAQQLIFGL